MDFDRGNAKVKGFLDTKGMSLVNGDGEPIVLSGWGLGNWLLCEGYMWGARNVGSFDRPRRIEQRVRELTGSDYASRFWQSFRDNYVTEADIKYMAELGYNSVRIPINSRLFIEEEPGIRWVDEGFERLDRCLDWCEKYRVYAFIDLHGAPGGQSGANIDDTIDDMPRLFLDDDCFDKGVELWRKLAERYKDRWIVGGYDLLNEPIRPSGHMPEKPQIEYLFPRLVEFYDAAIAAIRSVDKRHVLSIEGHHWSTHTSLFYKKYDEKMLLHFHRYACVPDASQLEPFLKVARELDCPLWLGETGENRLEWFSAFFPTAAQLGISVCVWPWKKMDNCNSPCTVKQPEGWQEEIVGYSQYGKHPGYERAQELLDQYIENMKLENCVLNAEPTASLFRVPGCTVRATDFDHFPGKGVSFSGTRETDSLFDYRRGTRMRLVETCPRKELLFTFDSGWDRLALELASGEFACYTFNDVPQGASLAISCKCEQSATLEISADGDVLARPELSSTDGDSCELKTELPAGDRIVIKLKAESGTILVESLTVK